jgi:hypothetical protein
VFVPNCAMAKIDWDAVRRERAVRYSSSEARRVEVKVKRGRPLDSEKGLTLTAMQPWKKLGMSKRTWYRRRREGKE